MLENVQDLLNLMKETALDLGLDFVDLTGRSDIKSHYMDVMKILNQMKVNSTIYSTVYSVAVCLALVALVYMVYQLAVKKDLTKKWVGLVIISLAGAAYLSFTLDKWAIQDYDALVFNETIAVQVEYLKSSEGHQNKTKTEFESYYHLVKAKVRESNRHLSPAGVKMLKPEQLANYYGNLYSIFNLEKLEEVPMSANRNQPIYYYMTDRFRELHAENAKQLIGSADFTMTTVAVIAVNVGLIMVVAVVLVRNEELETKYYLGFLTASVLFTLMISPFMSYRVNDLKAQATRYYNQVEEVISITK